MIYVSNEQIWILVTWHVQQISNGLLLVFVRITLNKAAGKGSIMEPHSNPVAIRYGKVLHFEWKSNWVLSYKTNVLLDCLLTILMAQSVPTPINAETNADYTVLRWKISVGWTERNNNNMWSLSIRPNSDYFKLIFVRFDIHLVQLVSSPTPIQHSNNSVVQKHTLIELLNSWLSWHMLLWLGWKLVINS